MNKWKPHLPKTTNRLILEYHRCKNPVTRAVLRDIINNNRYNETREKV